ncbi:MAG TPA: acyl-CoA dehydrogenase family protein [Terriglobia bacterium]|nr:acyl-CoA dehydrogenase family protein [Terriglobia bacterium]
MTESKTLAAQGGAFLIESSPPDSIFTPEDLNDQQRLIAQTAEEFVNQEIVPRLREIEQKQPGLLRELLKKAADLGLCATDVPECYGGLDLDKVSSIIVSEKMARDGAWAATIGAQSGIAILPIVLFGTEEQKAKYVPRLARVEWVGAYCLSESGSGSDALHCKTRATLSPDGKHYILNGTKMWTTNGGIADVYIVFARVDGEHFTAFIVERASPGVEPGAEEHKMGIRGSSTTPVVFENVYVPVKNVLGEIGKGHRIAFNILNMGRLKLGAGCIGGSKILMTPAIQWAKERQAFGRPIAGFGLIKEKLGQMVERIYAAESMSFRTAGMIDARIGEAGNFSATNEARSQPALAALQEYAVECSILKVAGTECLDRVTDETVQIFGGYGFSADYEIERTYRDQRVNRIYEGTNEINRLLIIEMLLKRSMKGELALIPAAQKVLDRALDAPSFDGEESNGPLAAEARMVEGAKQAALLLAGGAAQRFGQTLSEEQEVIGALSNLVIEIYAMESALLRASKRVLRSQLEAARPHCDAARCFIHGASDRIEMEARRVLPRLAEGDALRAQSAMLRRFLKHPPVDTIALKRRLADRAVKLGRYPFAV